MPELLSPHTTHSIFWFFTSLTCVPLELPIDDDPDVVVLLLFVELLLLLLLLLLLFDELSEPFVLLLLCVCECMPFDVEFCCIGNISHFEGVDCDKSNSHFGWGCDRSDCDGASVVKSSETDPMWFERLVSRQPECGGGATSPIPRENPSSNGLKSDAWLRGLKNPEAVDGEGHNTPPPYTLNALWVIILPVFAAPQSAGGPILSRKILTF